MISIPHIHGPRLTFREKEISTLIAQGYSSKQIAVHLSISIFTVANHRKNILKKKGIKRIKDLFA